MRPESARMVICRYLPTGSQPPSGETGIIVFRRKPSGPPCCGVRSPSAYLAASTRVLSAEYAEGLRRAYFCFTRKGSGKCRWRSIVSWRMGYGSGGVADGRQPLQALYAYPLLRSCKRPDGVVLMDELLLQVQGHKKSALFRGRFSYGLMCVEAFYSSLPSRLAFTSGLCL